uniref:Uncharacterized protein n=1 Tax=Opuntia streptacantha TaxID=393608 RepID=A0A7C8ZQD1_OPUST
MTSLIFFNIYYLLHHISFITSYIILNSFHGKFIANVSGTILLGVTNLNTTTLLSACAFIGVTSCVNASFDTERTLRSSIKHLYVPCCLLPLLVVVAPGVVSPLSSIVCCIVGIHHI